MTGDGSPGEGSSRAWRKGVDPGILYTLGGRTHLMSRIYDNDSFRAVDKYWVFLFEGT